MSNSSIDKEFRKVGRGCSFECDYDEIPSEIFWPKHSAERSPDSGEIRHRREIEAVLVSLPCNQPDAFKKKVRSSGGSVRGLEAQIWKSYT